MVTEADCSSMQLELFDRCEMPQRGYIQDFVFSKTYQDYYQAMKEWISVLYWHPIQNAKFQCLVVEDGHHPEWLEADDAMLHGDASMLNVTSHNEGTESSLSAILVKNTDVPEKYYLSKKACLGILRRSNENNKELPPALRQAFEQQAGIRKHEPMSIVGGQIAYSSSKTYHHTYFSKEIANSLVATDWKDAPTVAVVSNAYAVGDGQMHQSMMTDKVGALNCMHNGGQKVMVKIE